MDDIRKMRVITDDSSEATRTVRNCAAILDRHMRIARRQSRLSEIDADEIRRITHSMRRDTWRPPAHCYASGRFDEREACRAYIRHWRVTSCTELVRIGINYATYQNDLRDIARIELLNGGVGAEARQCCTYIGG